MRKITLFKPFPYQRAVIEGMINHWEDSIHVMKSKRQIGKSLLCCNLLIWCSLKEPDQTSVCISPTLSQSRKIFKDIQKLLKDSGTISNANAATFEIQFVNGSTVYFKSGEQRDSLRGFTVSKHGLLVIDEAAYISDPIISMTFPFVDANHSCILMTSTPRWKDGFFYNFYMQGKKGDGKVYSYDVNDYDTSNLLSKEKLELYRSQLPTQIFRSDYLGYFLEADSDVFGSFDHVISDDFEEGEEYVGVDWSSGSGGDYTVVSIFNTKHQQTYLEYFNDKSPLETLDRILEILIKRNPKQITVEQNSIGSVYGDLLKSRIKQHHLSTKFRYFNTSNSSKRKIIEGFASEIQQGTCQLLNVGEQKTQLAAFQLQKTKGGLITYAGAQGYHDDIVMADAIALDSLSSGPRFVVL